MALHLNQKTLKELKRKLLAQKKALEEELEKFAEKNPRLKDDWKARYEDIGDDWDENAQEVTDYETRLPIEYTLELRLKNTNEALKRLEEGGYGLCEIDQQPIPVERLKAKPETTTCLEHADSR